MARPKEFNQAIADEVCRRLAECGSLRRVCASDDMPYEYTVRRWYVENEDFAVAYARAKEAGIDALVDETLDIADDGSNDWMRSNKPDNEAYVLNGEHSSRSKIRIETRRWLAERMLPKKYGVRTAHELSGPDGGPIQVDETVRSARIAALLAKAKERSDLV
jgi:hypothetical protein